jgi:hypothetical protein
VPHDSHGVSHTVAELSRIDQCCGSNWKERCIPGSTPLARADLKVPGHLGTASGTGGVSDQLNQPSCPDPLPIASLGFLSIPAFLVKLVHHVPHEMGIGMSKKEHADPD